jgi:hypothetical protein
MGRHVRVTCKHCSTVFEAFDGGGFRFHMLHCQQCGDALSVNQDDMGDTFQADEDGQNAWVAKNVPPCSCGGRYTLKARGRCPKCNSDDWDMGNAKLEMLYD